MRYSLLLILIFFIQTYTLIGQTIWNGPPITFTKENGVDWMLSENQDRITEFIWLTRGDTQGLFNASEEIRFDKSDDSKSPVGTMWAKGTTSNIDNLTFKTLSSTANGSVKNIVGENLVLHIVEEDIYIDLVFNSWASGKEGGKGGFSYERSTPGSTSTIKKYNDDLAIYPNPVSNYIMFNNIYDISTLELIDLNGYTLKIFSLNKGENNLNLEELSTGTYFLKSENIGSIKVIKR